MTHRQNPINRARRRMTAVLAVVGMALGGLALAAAPAGAAEPFDCSTSTVFIAQGNPSQLFKLEVNGDASMFVEVGPPASTRYNAIGFHPGDLLIYGVEQQTGRIVAVGADGGVDDLGSTTPPLPSGINTGAIDPATGAYYVMQMAGDTLYEVDLGSLAVTATPLTTSPSVSDITFVDGLLWAQEIGTSQLVRIDPSSGAVTTFSTSFIPTTVRSGASWTYANGNLGLSDNRTGDIYQVAITDASSDAPSFELIAVSSGPRSIFNDGTSCDGRATDLSLAKAGSSVLPGGTVTWTLTVTNDGPGTSSGYVVTDQLPDGVVDPTTDTPGCAIDAAVLTCVGGELAAGDSDELTVSATVPADTVPGTVVANDASVLGNEPDPVPDSDTASVEVTVGTPPAPACAEDGLAVTQAPHMPPGSNPPIVSGTVHQVVEPLVDPLVSIVGLDGLVHDLNCGVVEPVEDLVDDVTIPIVTEVKKLLRGLLR